ncbi:hypothetical protein PINS_up011251 [Pythium insidiosum]|nr:hypothetical protein PINS_up011251 [Pythium insidiosum]
MAAAVSEFLGLAFARVVDQFWRREHNDDALQALSSADANEIVDPTQHQRGEAPPLKPEVKTRTARRKSRKLSSQRKPKRHAVTEQIYSAAPKSRSLSLTSEPSDCSSNASTCASSDEEDSAEEDLGEKEMRLMRERAEEIKRLARSTRQTTRGPRKLTATAKTEASLSTAQSVPNVCEPLRITNATNGLWKWTVFAGFSVDIDCRGLRRDTRPSLRQVFCDADDTIDPEDESRWQGIVEGVLADA